MLITYNVVIKVICILTLQKLEKNNSVFPFTHFSGYDTIVYTIVSVACGIYLVKILSFAIFNYLYTRVTYQFVLFTFLTPFKKTCTAILHSESYCILYLSGKFKEGLYTYMRITKQTK